MSIFDAVSGAAAVALDSNGVFTQAFPDTFGADRLISKTRAVDLARAYVRDFGPQLRDDWADATGVAISVAALRECRQPTFVESPYQPIAAGVSLTARKAYGPRFWVQFCQSTPRVLLVVAVAALAIDVELDSGGLRPQDDLSVSFQASPVPQNWDVPLDAEGVATGLAISTSTRVATVPAARARRNGLPFFVDWSTEMERGVRLVDAADPSSARVLVQVLFGDDGQRRSAMFRRDTTVMVADTSTAYDPVGATPGSPGRAFTLVFVPQSRSATVRVVRAP
ncbi:MAG: hypothetical protein HYX65_05885 [Gemmatimonadetes bacterium]|nr:hypothetical protein [Gemmatimonadota bacterium]